MTQKNSWVINKDASQVTACRKWYGPVTWFIGGSTVFTSIFLIFILYRIALKDGVGTTFGIVSFLGLLVAGFLIYATLMYFVNESQLTVSKNKLSFKDSPLPSIGVHLEVETDQIDQLFVTRVKGNAAGTVNNYYELKAKLKDGETKVIIPYNYQLNEDKALDLEQKVESFLGISDEYVRGEYIEPVPTNFEKIQQKPKRVSMEDSYIYNSKIEDWIFIKEHHQIIHITQYDWTNGDSDKLYQTINENENEQLFYLDRNKGLLNIYSETAISLSEMIHLNIKSEAPKASFIYQDQLFTLDQIYEGNAFYDGQKGATETKQLVYFSKNKKEIIRVVFNGTSPHYYIGSKMETVDFEELDTDLEQLDLNVPLKEKSLDLLDRDFV